MPGQPPTPAEHITKADENKKFGFAMIATHPTSAGWALVALFYSALHYAEAYFLKCAAKKPDSHQERFDAIKSDPRLKSIYSQYRFLYDYSYNARYTLRRYGKTDVDKARPAIEALEKYFKSLV